MILISWSGTYQSVTSSIKVGSPQAARNDRTAYDVTAEKVDI